MSGSSGDSVGPRYPLSAKDLINPTDSIKMKMFSFLATSLSFFAYGALVLSVFSEYWLFTYESTVQNINGNETRITQVVHSGLWKFCYQKDNARGDVKVNLSSLPWRVDSDLCCEVTLTGPLQRSSSTLGAIQRIVRNTLIYPCFCLVVLMSGLLVNVMGYFSTLYKRIYFFLSGVFFVIAGLFIILSLVTYAATTNSIAEGWPSVIGKSAAEMKYSYGWSFFLCGFSLLSSEGAGVFALYYFLAASSNMHKTSNHQTFQRPVSPVQGILRNGNSANGAAYTMIRNPANDSIHQTLSATTSAGNYPSEDSTELIFKNKPQYPAAVTFYPFFIPNGDDIGK